MGALHPHYLAQVLSDRGERAPATNLIEAYVGSLDPTALTREKLRLCKIAQGVDASDDIGALLDAIRAAAPRVEEPAAESAPPATANKLSQSRSSTTKSAASVTLLRAHGIHAYSKGAALKIELDTLRAEEKGEAVQYTIQIEAARANAGRYDWERKVPFQLTRRELPLLATFLLGFGPETLVFNNHGPNTDKRLEVLDQGGKVFVKLGYAGRAAIPVPVEAADVFAWGELCMVALRLNRPLVDAGALLALLRRIGKMAAADT